jgi:CRP-like cAMP-binding protein
MASPLLLKLQKRDHLSAEEQEVVEALRGAVRDFEPGEAIVRQGDRPSFSSVMQSGWAARVKFLADGQRAISALHMAGDFVDLHSLLLKPMDHSVLALTPCRIVTVPHEDLRRATERCPHLTRILWLDTLIDAAIHREWIAGLGRRSAASRLAHLFCELLMRAEAVGLVERLGYDLPLTQAMLADVLGITAVHVNRSLQELRQNALVRFEGGRLTIIDWDRLAELADFDPAYLNLTSEPR